MYRDKRGRVYERRRKRKFIPAIYFMAEVVLAWLILSLIQLSFNFDEWSIWAVLIFIVSVLYSTFKTIHVYRRQKNYPSATKNE